MQEKPIAILKAIDSQDVTPNAVRRALALALILALSQSVGGCAAVGITMLGVGTGIGAAHHLGGISYKTFTESLPDVKRATIAALRRMAIEVSAVERMENGERIVAKAADRDIEIELESLTPRTTRMRSVARQDGGLLVDSATAVEIIIQTEKALVSSTRA